MIHLLIIHESFFCTCECLFCRYEWLFCTCEWLFCMWNESRCLHSRVLWLIFVFITPHSWITLLHTWMTFLHICMRHITCVNESCYSYEWAMSYIWMSPVTRMNALCHKYEWITSRYPYERVTSRIWMTLYMNLSDLYVLRSKCGTVLV